jgi:Predicted hydrolases or acyltransferases (alpha/beta hydrolase superfamily)
MKFKIIISAIILLSFTRLTYGQTPLASGDHFADINGIKLHYYVSGKGPICLMPTPGWGPSINYLKKSLKPIEKYFTMVYYDTRISGSSTGPEDRHQYTSRDFMNDMDSLRVFLKQKKVWIMGHSMGGFQVLNYGINHNDNLNGIIALAPLAGRDSLYEAEFTKMVMKRKGQPYFEQGSNIFFGRDTTKNKNSEMMPFILPFYFHDANKISNFEKLGDPQLSDKAGEYTDASLFGTEYLFPQLKKIKVPTLIIVGDDDFICDRISQADRITKNILNASEIVIKDAGHFSWIEQPTQFFIEIEKWLKKQKLTLQK